MADAPETNPKIDSLRAKVDADAKSRHFYPLAEELRKIGQLDEAEKVLRTGLEHHSTYLSAWISLGRVLKDRGSYSEAIDALMKGLSLDPENVVAAKLLAHVYLAMGEKVEAIKKFKLVHALMPADEEAEEQIALLEREINQPEQGAAPASEPVTADVAPPEPAAAESPHDSTEPPFPMDSAPIPTPPLSDVEPQAHPETNFDLTNPDPFSLGGQSPAAEPELAEEPAPFADSELPDRAAAESPETDEDPFSSTAPVIEEPAQPQRAPSSEDIWAEEAAGEVTPESPATVTMAQILVQQGHIDQAKETFEKVLAREPGNEAARQGLETLEARQQNRDRAGGRSERLEAWRRKVVRQ